MYKFAKKLQSFDPYQPITAQYDIRLDANESYISLPESMKNEIAEAVKELRFNRYPDASGGAVLPSFCDYYGVETDCVTVGNGSDELISVIINGFMERGETVLTILPDFSMYSFYSQLCELDVVALQKNDMLEISVDEILNKSKECSARCIIFSNPCNPTSLGISAAEVERLLNETDALVIVDEAYMDFWNQSVMSKIHDYDNLIVLRTASKAIGLAAVRLGFAVASPSITNILRAVKSPYNTDSISQAVGAIAYFHKDYLKACTEALINGTRKLRADITKIAESYPDLFPIVFQGVTNFVLLKCNDTNKLRRYFDENSVSLRYFNDYVRITCGSPIENETVVELLESFAQKY